MDYKDLANAWKERVPSQLEGEEYLDQWKETLTGYDVRGYVNSIRCSMEDLLLRGSTFENSSESFLYVPEGEPMEFEVLAAKKSLLAATVGPRYLAGDQFVKFTEPTLSLALRRYSCEEFSSLPLPYISDSLRRGELELSGLNIEYVTQENDVLRITLKDENYGL